jgi:hypothetical protein
VVQGIRVPYMFSRISSVPIRDTEGSGDCGSGFFTASADKEEKPVQITWIQQLRREPRA